VGQYAKKCVCRERNNSKMTYKALKYWNS